MNKRKIISLKESIPFAEATLYLGPSKLNTNFKTYLFSRVRPLEKQKRSESLEGKHSLKSLLPVKFLRHSSSVRTLYRARETENQFRFHHNAKMGHCCQSAMETYVSLRFKNYQGITKKNVVFLIFFL